MMRISIVIAILIFIRPIRAAELSIFDIQYTADPNGQSPHNGSIIDCTGGIVTHKPPTGKPRLIIQDPADPEGWGAIQVKDLFNTGIFADVDVGDWISLTNVLVEDNKGTTFLQYIDIPESRKVFLTTIINCSQQAPRISLSTRSRISTTTAMWTLSISEFSPDIGSRPDAASRTSAVEQTW